MTNRALWNWAVWIGVLAGIYVFLYASIPALAKVGFVWMTFTALPIYFISGAKREEYWNFTASAAAGVAWALLYLYLMKLVAGYGVSGPVTQLLVVGLLTIVVLAFHFIVTPNTLLNKAPMMFCGLALTFSTGGANFLYIFLTMWLAITLGLACQEGTNLLNADGSWKIFSRDTGIDKQTDER